MCSYFLYGLNGLFLCILDVLNLFIMHSCAFRWAIAMDLELGNMFFMCRRDFGHSYPGFCDLLPAMAFSSDQGVLLVMWMTLLHVHVLWQIWIFTKCLDWFCGSCVLVSFFSCATHTRAQTHLPVEFSVLVARPLRTSVVTKWRVVMVCMYSIPFCYDLCSLWPPSVMLGKGCGAEAWYTRVLPAPWSLPSNQIEASSGHVFLFPRPWGRGCLVTFSLYKTHIQSHTLRFILRANLKFKVTFFWHVLVVGRWDYIDSSTSVFEVFISSMAWNYTTVFRYSCNFLCVVLMRSIVLLMHYLL